MNQLPIEEKEQIEIQYWAQSPTEKPEVESIDNLLNKMTDAPVFLERMKPFDKNFEEASTILELGGGQGWASCLVKRLYPDTEVIVSDISEFALASVHQWERIFKVKIDRSFACRSYEIPLSDASVDLIFCFAAAHHFVAHRRTFCEINRVLRPGGKCFYFHEPSCNALMYRAAHHRVNRIRPEVPEDVLIYSKIKTMAEECGLSVRLHADTSMLKRGQTESLYYWLMGRFAFLQRILPCTRDFEFTKG